MTCKKNSATSKGPEIRLWGLERRLALALEEGKTPKSFRSLARGWAWAARRETRFVAPPNALLIGVEGSTLGGSWKTPASLALAEALVRCGQSVGYWSRGHRRSNPGRGWVTPRMSPEEAGDEALLAARRLAPLGVPVAVGPPEQAIPELARRGGVIVADSLRVARGENARALLVLDEEKPWGAGCCPPAGDLRAPRDVLLASCSAVLVVGSGPVGLLPGGWWRGEQHVEFKRQGLRAAAVTAIARPERFVKALRAGGIQVLQQIALPDHGGPGAAEEAARQLKDEIDVVVCTEKCALWLPKTLGGRPVEALPLRIELPGELVRSLGAFG